ncbi:MAG TPA: TonB-dependent receptor [Steroidobacteraceae bacterium]|nr:TonB-dependent receptor [Steroidobacteraceae bacterium]
MPSIGGRGGSLRLPAMALGLVSGLGFLSAAAAAGDDAATGTGGLEEIVVTATRRAERLQDVAVSATAFTQEKLDVEGLRSIDDLTRLTPGVTFQRDATTSAGNFNDEDSDINIRGIDSTAGTSTVGIYIDDTPIQGRHISFTSFNAFPALFDLERVEVLRGPQGTLFGAGSEGGTVRFIQPSPDLHTESVYLRSEAGTTHDGAASYEIGGAVGGPIVADTLGFRVSASFREDGGWVDHVNYATRAVTDSDSNYQDTVVVRGALKWAIDERLSITPSVYYQQLRLGDTSAYWPSLSDPTAGNFENGNAQRNPSTDPFYLAAVKIEWDTAFAQLSSDTSYFSRNQHSISDYTQFDRALFGLTLPPPAGDLGTSHDADNQNNFYQEIRVQSPDPAAALLWTTGVFYSHLDENTTEHVFDPNLNAEYNAAYGVPFCTPQAPCPNGEILTQPISQIIDRQYALYGDATLQVFDSLKLTAGLRASHISYSGDLVYYGPFLSPTSGPLTPLAAAGSNDENPITPKAVIAYQPDRADLLYVSAAKGYRPGGINGPLSSICGSNLSSIGLTAGPEIYAADSLWSYELGTKNSFWDGRMLFDASAFLIDWNNIQQAVYLPACGQNFVENLGKVRSVGGEVEMQTRPVEALLFDVSVAHVDAKYTHTVCAGPSACTGADAPSLPVVTAGDRLPGAPWTFLTSAEYALPAIASRKPYLRLDFQYTTAQTALQPIQDPNNGVSDPTYTGLPQTRNLSLRAGLRFGGIDLSLFAQNLTDSHPVLSHTRDTTTSDLFYDHTVRPRTVGVTATYRR